MIRLNKEKIEDIVSLIRFLSSKIIKNTYIHIVLISFAIILTIIYISNYKVLKIEIPDINYKTQHHVYIIDAGHGFDEKNDCKWKSVKDAGSCFYEYEFNKKVADFLCAMLDNAGIFYLRTDTLTDQRDLSITKRVKFVNNIKKKLDEKSLVGSNRSVVLFSIHANAAENKKANGLEVFTSIEKCKKYKDREVCEKNMHSLATLLADNLKLVLPSKKFRTTNEAEYKESSMARYGEITLLADTDSYAVLSENGFYTNSEERNEMKTAEYQTKIATAHYKTICALEGISPYFLSNKK